MRRDPLFAPPLSVILEFAVTFMPAIHAQTPKAPVHVSSGVMAGLLLKHVNPVIPSAAHAHYSPGTVVLHAIISKEGKVVELTVISGAADLRQPVLTAVRQWTYRPFLLNGTPVPVDTIIMIELQLGAG